MGTARQAALSLATGLLLAACQQAVPAGPSPIANPDDQILAPDGSTEDATGPSPTGPRHTDLPVRDDSGTTAGEGSPSPTVSSHASWSPSPTSSPDGPAPSPSPSPTSSPSPTPSPTPSVGGCPDARTCGDYDLNGGRWPAGPDGTISIRYRIRTDGHIDTDFSNAPSAGEMIAMIRAAAKTWMDANPRIKLIYDGVTTDAPANGNNVIGWGTSPTGQGYSTASAHHTPGPFGPTYTGFHVIIEQTSGWSWNPCDPEAGQPCTAEGPNDAADFQGMVTHEWGHVLGLAHPCSDLRCDAEELTMRTGVPMRIRQTLALGDILGLRELYPTDTAMPVIYRP